MNNLKEDLSTLTNTSETLYDKLLKNIIYIINDYIYNNIINNINLTEIDIGIGTLYIKYENDEIKYKFIPNTKFNKSIENTLINKQNLLVTALEANLSDKIKNIQKELI